MPTNHAMTDYLALDGFTDDGTTLSWTSASHHTNPYDVVDVNDDGNMDIGQDWFAFEIVTFTGYTVELGGLDYGVFLQAPSIYVIPFNTAVADISGFTGPGSTSTRIDNADVANCFLTGTLIATPEGERAVETLAPGDLVTTADGRAVPVVWVGRQTMHKLFSPPERFCPVRVRAGALGAGLPHSDLRVTADHALILDGMAICAGALVNGTTIAYDPIGSLPERVTYHHVETERHEAILANGAAAETYVDYVARRTFDNHAEYRALHGEERTIPEMDLPRIAAARLVPPTIRARLAAPDAA